MSDEGTMRAVEVPAPGAAFRIVDRPVPDPGPDEVRVAVDACGVCGGDVHVREENPTVDYPRIPGHEVVGTVDAVGDRVAAWSAGDRVGVGWHGGHCGTCRSCRRGEVLLCDDGAVTGMHRDGGYAEYLLADRGALAAIPDDLGSVDAAPLLCAGLTTFNALRNADARPGDLVAVVGVGGLGHLGLQYARTAGFETVAVSGGPGKRDAARALGADHFVDSDRRDVGAALRDLGGAQVVLSTAPASDVVAAAADGLATNGTVLVLGSPPDPIPVDAGALSRVRGSVAGWASGSPQDAEDALAFSALRDVTTTVETYPLEAAETAYQRMLDGDVEFRAVLVP